MADLAFVDTHVHFWDLEHPDLRYVWLEPGWIHPLLGDIRSIKAPLYGADEFIAETRFANVSKVVHVQAAIGTVDPVDETRWLDQAAERTGVPTGIVADCRLAAADAASVLDQHAGASSRMRGIRDFGEGDYMNDPAWRRGYARLAQNGWVCDLDCFWEGMATARDLARAFPDITLVLGHAGFPQSRDAEYFAAWKGGISALAEAENAVCKISGLGMKDPHWTVDSLRPWVLHCIEAFGVDRCFFGTNWPVDRLYSSYGDVVDAYAEIIAGFSRDEQTALFSGNAERVYGI